MQEKQDFEAFALAEWKRRSKERALAAASRKRLHRFSQLDNIIIKNDCAPDLAVAAVESSNFKNDRPSSTSTSSCSGNSNSNQRTTRARATTTLQVQSLKSLLTLEVDNHHHHQIEEEPETTRKEILLSAKLKMKTQKHEDPNSAVDDVIGVEDSSSSPRPWINSSSLLQKKKSIAVVVAKKEKPKEKKVCVVVEAQQKQILGEISSNHDKKTTTTTTKGFSVSSSFEFEYGMDRPPTPHPKAASKPQQIPTVQVFL